MTPRPTVKPPRDRILDAAFEVMRSSGLANATTKQIARQAGYSEAMLYKHFADKQELFLAVLEERVPPVTIEPSGAPDADLVTGLARLVEQLMEFFVTAFPIAASVFSLPDLLHEHRAGVTALGRGPEAPVLAVTAYLEAERAAGRVDPAADCAAAARLLVGAAFHQGFLAAFAGRPDVPDAPRVATALATTLAHPLLPS